ncbi:unnamed protein product [Amoebophrya sp. A120]|nr:unnamed protein product [Amoebophrya sp. A120]|eukprot:GSA120T00000319001.1
MEIENKKHIYVTGRVNAGKTTFVERFLKYIGYRHLPTIDWKRGCGGITRAPLPGTTAHFLSFSLPRNFKLIDTPGVPSTHQMTSKLLPGGSQQQLEGSADGGNTNLPQHCLQDLYDVVPRSQLQPVTYALKPGRSLIIGALARIDLLEPSTFAFVTCFFSKNVTLHVCNTGKAEDAMERKAGSFFYPPHLKETFAKFDFVKHNVRVFGSNHRAWDDIAIAGLGWVAVSGFGSKEFAVHVPKGVKLFRRPSMMPWELCVNGVQKFSHRHRARGSSVARKKKKMVQLLRDRDRKYALCAEREKLEEDREGRGRDGELEVAAGGGGADQFTSSGEQTLHGGAAPLDSSQPEDASRIMRPFTNASTTTSKQDDLFPYRGTRKAGTTTAAPFSSAIFGSGKLASTGAAGEENENSRVLGGQFYRHEVDEGHRCSCETSRSTTSGRTTDHAQNVVPFVDPSLFLVHEDEPCRGTRSGARVNAAAAGKGAKCSSGETTTNGGIKEHQEASAGPEEAISSHDDTEQHFSSASAIIEDHDEEADAPVLELRI